MPSIGLWERIRAHVLCFFPLLCAFLSSHYFFHIYIFDDTVQIPTHPPTVITEPFFQSIAAHSSSRFPFAFCATHQAIKQNERRRRFAKKKKLGERAGHMFGYLALTSMLKYCYELGVRYVTIYAFSIDNFRRSPEEVQSVMDLMLEKIELLIREESLVNKYGVRLYFLGNLNLLSEPVKKAVEKAMAATRNNNRAILAICIAYTSTDEIVHAVEKSCEEKWDEMNSKSANGVGYDLGKVAVAENGENNNSITLADVEKHMYASIIPDPDMLIRTSGEARLSNFLLWQTSFSYLYSPSVLWPEINFWHLLWAVLNFQRNHLYLVKKRKQL